MSTILSFQISSHSELLGLGFTIFLRVKFTAGCRTDEIVMKSIQKKQRIEKKRREFPKHA